MDPGGQVHDAISRPFGDGLLPGQVEKVGVPGTNGEGGDGHRLLRKCCSELLYSCLDRVAIEFRILVECGIDLRSMRRGIVDRKATAPGQLHLPRRYLDLVGLDAVEAGNEMVQLGLQSVAPARSVDRGLSLARQIAAAALERAKPVRYGVQSGLFGPDTAQLGEHFVGSHSHVGTVPRGAQVRRRPDSTTGSGLMRSG